MHAIALMITNTKISISNHCQGGVFQVLNAYSEKQESRETSEKKPFRCR